MRERGSVTVVLVTVTALLCLLLVATASIAGLVSARTQAGAAADAAALAAAVATHPDTGRAPPRTEAVRAARANGANVVECRCPIDSTLATRTVTVTVFIEVNAPIFGQVRVHASSRAEFDPRAWLGR